MSTTTFTVDGMTCGHCVAAITTAVTRLDGVNVVEVDLASRAVTVHSDDPIDPEDFAAAVSDAGYEVVA